MNSAEVDSYFDSEVGPVWRELRGDVWHSTGSHRFRQMLRTGTIEPNPDLAEGEFKWATLGTTMCRAIDGVSLFDFEAADWPWLFETKKHNYWCQFLGAPGEIAPADTWISTVWIAADRSRLPGLLSLNDASHEWQLDLSNKWMPRLETCHRGALPLSACLKVVVACAVEPKEFQVMGLHPFDLAELDRLESSWRARYADSYQIRTLTVRERFARMSADGT